MASIATELIENGTKVDGRGRRIVTTKEREALMAAYQSSGMTQRAFAQREGIKYSTFTSWIQGRRHAATATSKAVSAEVAMLPGGPEAPVASGELSVQLPDGALVRGRGAREIGELIRVLRGVRGC